MAKTLAASEGDGVLVDWIDREIGKILKAKEHHQLSQNVDKLRERVATVQRQLDEMVGELERVEAEMPGQRMDPTSSG